MTIKSGKLMHITSWPSLAMFDVFVGEECNV
jgi:hypothetical protein